SSFPYVQTPWPGDGKCGGLPVIYDQPTVLDPTGDLAAPSNLVADNGTFFIVPLTWKDNATNEEGFVIRRTSSQGTEMVASVGANVTSFTVQSSCKYLHRRNKVGSDLRQREPLSSCASRA
ncbi:MAG: hypothetical protein AAFQ92_21285, partial [Bacteroidota bacterium]